MEKTLNKIKLRSKIGFGLGDLGFNIGVQATALILIKFYTDTLLIGASMAGLVVLVSKIIDAITDPAMGMIADRTHTRWGKFRPYLLFGAIPFGLSFFLLLNAPMAMPLTGRIIYAFATYIFFCLMLTVTNVPYQSLLPVMTDSTDERVSFSSFRSVGGIIGVIIAAVAIESIVSMFGQGSEVTGYRVAGVITATIMVITTLVCFATTKEIVAPKKEKKTSVKDSLKLLTSNKPFMVLWFGVIFIMIGVNIIAATVFYYFEYVMLDPGMGAVGFLLCFLAAIACMPLYSKLSKTKSNKFSFIIGSIIMCAGILFIFAVGSSSVILAVVGLVIFGIGLSANYLCPWAMVANTVEYSQFKTGLRKEGTFYGMFFLVIKLSAAIAGFIVGQVLAAGAYVPNLAIQADSAVLSIRLLMSIIPAVLMTIGFIILTKYPITSQSHREMVAKIKAQEE